MAKTVAELREIVKVVRDRGDDFPTVDEMDCTDCPLDAELSCFNDDYIGFVCVESIAKYCDEQDTQPQ